MAGEDSSRGGGHLFATTVVGQKVYDERGERLRARVPLLLQLGGTVVDKNVGVMGLVIVCRVGIRDENGCEAELRKLAQACRSRARNHEVCGRIGVLHAMMEWRDVLGNAFPLLVGGGQAVVALSGKVNDLQGMIFQQRGAFEKDLVDARGPLAPAHDQQSAPVLFQVK